MNPVTELWNVAHELGQTCDMHTGLERRLANALDAIQKRGLLALLDLVATSNRRGLVRWAAGLSVAQTEVLRLAIQAGYEVAMDIQDSESAEMLSALASGFDTALSGGEGGAKEEANHEDEIRALETRLSEVREKIRSYDGGDRPSSPPAELLRKEAELSMRLHSPKSERDQAKPKPTILPAGKPPPFLRVGMKFIRPGIGVAVEMTDIDDDLVVPLACLYADRGILGWYPTAEVQTWPLAEPFTVEGES